MKNLLFQYVTAWLTRLSTGLVRTKIKYDIIISALPVWALYGHEIEGQEVPISAKI